MEQELIRLSTNILGNINQILSKINDPKITQEEFNAVISYTKYAQKFIDDYLQQVDDYNKLISGIDTTVVEHTELIS